MKRRFIPILCVLWFMATPVQAVTCAFSTPFVVGNCGWCGARGESTVTYFWREDGVFCRPWLRRYSWFPCFDARSCTVQDVLAGRCRDRSVLGNHVTKDAQDWQSFRINRIERRMYACLSGHGL